MTDPDTRGTADDAGLPLAVHRYDEIQPEPGPRIDPVSVGFWAVYAVALVAFVAVIASLSGAPLPPT